MCIICRQPCALLKDKHVFLCGELQSGGADLPVQISYYLGCLTGDRTEVPSSGSTFTWRYVLTALPFNEGTFYWRYLRMAIHFDGGTF